MLNYIKADMKRILKKKNFLVVNIVFLLLFALVNLFTRGNTNSLEIYTLKVEIFLSVFVFIEGMNIFLSVYNDNFKAKSMQVEIGRGVERKNVVISKLIETSIIALIASIVVVVFISAMAFIMGLSPTFAEMKEWFVSIIFASIKIIGYTAMASIFVYHKQNAVNGIIAFVLLASNVASSFASIALSQSFVTNIFGNLSDYLFSSAISSVRSEINITMTIIVLAYIVISTLISILIFNKKELEF